MEYRIKQDWYKEDLWEVFEIDKTNPDSSDGDLIFKGTIEQVNAFINLKTNPSVIRVESNNT